MVTKLAIDMWRYQGRLEPVEAFLKNNKRGLGADRVKKKVHPPHTDGSKERDENVSKSILGILFL